MPPSESTTAAASSVAFPPARRRTLALAAGMAALGAAGWGAWRLARPGGPRTLPDVAYPIVDGRRIGPADLAGRVVLVNFWATTCTVCIAEMPELVALYEAFRPRGLELIAVAMPYDRPDRVLHFASTRRLPFPVALDPMGEAVAAWGGVEATPLTWLAGPDGRIRGRWLGRPDFAKLRRDVEALLPAAAA
jgi:peroxiredoxin